MVSNLKSIVVGIVEEKEIKIENYQSAKLSSVENDLNSGKLDIDGAVGQVREIFSFHLKEDAYREITKQLKYNL